jgi:hypothetical protein
MGKSLESRLNGNKQEFIRDIGLHGDWTALELWKEKLGGYSSYIGLRKFIEEETGDSNYGINPSGGISNHQSTFKKFIAAWSEFYSQLSSENKQLRAENEALKRELKIREAEDLSMMMPLMEEMKRV